MSKNLYCPGLKVLSKKGKDNYDKIFRKDEIKKEYCSCVFSKEEGSYGNGVCGFCRRENE